MFDPSSFDNPTPLAHADTSRDVLPRTYHLSFHNIRAPIEIGSLSEREERNHSRSCQVIYSQFGLAIHQNDHQARRRFVEWAQNEIAVVPDFHKRILFTDEAHFWLNGYVNKQNCRIWSEANPQVYVKTPSHPEKLTVWCAFMGWWNPSSKPMKATTLQSMELWFQQDGATCHTARATIDLLKDTFGNRLISRFGPVNWPPRSCDLTPLDYFLWGYVKSLVYADKPQTLDHLKDNIRRVIADIRPQMLEKVIENWTSRLDYIRTSRGRHIQNVRIPKTYREATRTSEAVDWEGAMDKEMQVMYDRKVWNLVEPPKEAEVLGCRLDEVIYMQQPEGYVNEADKINPLVVCRLHSDVWSDQEGLG
ncbi:uncharacterized protein TNCV_4678001 [Trichonephila clavipes]|nr:uncharacterized protein TNCV_4678001 [Trichonephila clavipes]